MATFVLRLVSLLVPSDRRETWLAEWSAELEHARTTATQRGELSAWARARLTVRAMESVPDALWLRWRRVSQGRPVEGVRHALRSLVRRPSYSLTVIGTLALGIGSSTAIFTVVDALVVKPIPFEEPDELVLLSGGQTLSMDAEALRAWTAQTSVFEDVKAHMTRPFILTGAREARDYGGLLVEPGFLALLGIRPALGRPLTPDDAIGDSRVVLLSDDVWRGAFGSDPGVVGRTVELDGEPHEVVGVLPPTLRLMPGGVVHLVAPLSDPPPFDAVGGLGRLREGVSLDVAQARLDDVADVLSRERPREGGWDVRLRALSRMDDPAVRRGLLALGAAVICLLLIAYANAAGLLLLRGVSRRTEFRLRAALGAPRSSLLAQVLLESTLLAAAAGALGMIFAWWGVQGLVALLPSDVLRFSYTTVSVDERVLAFSLLLTGLTGIAFGTLPAWRAARTATGVARRTMTAARDEVRLRVTMQVAQFALALILLAGAGLFTRSFQRLMTTDPGYAADEVLQLQLVSLERVAGEAATVLLARELDERLRAIPGVAGVARASSGSGYVFGFTLETPDRGPWEPAAKWLPRVQVDTAYFRTMGIPILEGRGFTASDVVAGDAVVIDRDLARALWPNRPAVGQRFRIRSGPWLTVVGVSDDVRLDGPREPLGPYMLFHPGSHQDLRAGMVIIRTSRDVTTVARAVRDLVAELDPDQPIRSLRTGTQALQETIADPRLLATIMAALAGSALFLAVVGIYGLSSFSVAQRRREIGVRIALGADAGRVMLEVLRSGLLLAALGVAIGLVVAVFAARLLSDLLYETTPLDPLVLGLAVLALLAACAVALIGPARRAATADPAEPLRAD